MIDYDENYQLLQISEKTESTYVLRGIGLVCLSNTDVYIIWFNKWNLIYSWSFSMEFTSPSMIEHL